MGQFTGLMSVGVTFKISSNGLVAQTLDMTTTTKIAVITRKSAVVVIGNFQEEQHHIVLISQLNSMSNLLCTDAFCMNRTNKKCFSALYRMSW